MEKRKLSNTDLEVSSLCLGTMNFGQQCDEANAHEQMDYAVSRGMNFLDTAEVYPIPPEKEKQGRTETYIGNWLKKSGKRKDLIIATKVAPARQAATVIQTRDASLGLTRKSILEAVEGSLQRLQTDYIDLYQIHSPERDSNFFGVRGVQELQRPGIASIEETLETLGEIVKSGKVRYIGVSNETPWGVSEYLRLWRERSLPRIVSIQNQYSLLNRTFEIGLSEMCLRENIAGLPYSTLGMGVLTGKYLGGAKPPGARFTLYERNRMRYNPPHAQPVIERYVQIAKDAGITPGQLALVFARTRAFHTSVIIAGTTLEQLKEDIDSADMTLSPETLKAINAVYTEMPDPTC
jgi:aryl-alcohol dehydrogenase-like predicted oxidoreductase